MRGSAISRRDAPEVLQIRSALKKEQLCRK
jgi:hypothetical protein